MQAKSSPKNKLLSIVGPTSSGKSELAVKLARQFQGEIISCDSRQIYRGMNLGTGKVPGKWQALPFTRYPERGKGSQKQVFIYKGIPHHLIDFVNPKRQYSAALFQKKAGNAIAQILRRGHLPILCGGTGHWIDAVVFNQQLPEVQPNSKLRKKLETQTADELYHRLQELDAVRAANIDKHNKRRLIRALEIVISTGKPVPALQQQTIHNVLWLGINLSKDKLNKKIDQRLKQRIKAGMIKEVSRLRQQGLSWKRLEDFGLEYKFGALFLQKNISYDEMLRQMLLANRHYAKRQMMWFKRNKNIHWVINYDKALKLTKNFLKN